MNIFMPFIFLAAGLIFLIKGADLLVDGASSVAKRLNVSELVIGLTVVAFGTSTPELSVNIIASLEKNTDIAIGNILGSNIANVFLILGTASLIYPLEVGKGTVWREIPFSLLAALVMGILANDQLIDQMSLSILSRSDGLIFLLFFSIFMYYIIDIAHNTDDAKIITAPKYTLLKSLLFIILGLLGLIVGGKWIVDSAVKLSIEFGMSQSLAGLTIVAVGTSLPELATSVVAAYKKNADIAVGNVVGSNIFNIFFVLGISSIIQPLPFYAASNIDIAVVIFASLLLFFFMFTGNKRALDRWEGAIFLVFYISYITFLIMQ